MRPGEEDFHCQLSLWLPCRAVCFENRRTFGEAATSIFLPAGFVDKWDFCVSASHLPITVDSTDGWPASQPGGTPDRWWGQGHVELATGELGEAVAQRLLKPSLYHGFRGGSSESDVMMQVMGSRFWCLCFPLLPPSGERDQAKIKTDLTHHLLSYVTLLCPWENTFLTPLHHCEASYVLIMVLFWLYCVAGGIFVLWPGIEATPLALEAQCLNHWASREVLQSTFLLFFPLSLQQPCEVESSQAEAVALWNLCRAVESRPSFHAAWGGRHPSCDLSPGLWPSPDYPGVWNSHSLDCGHAADVISWIPLTSQEMPLWEGKIQTSWENVTPALGPAQLPHCSELRSQVEG